MLNVSLIADALRRHALAVNTGYCRDGTTATFANHYWMDLYGGIRFVAQVHAGRDVLFPVDVRHQFVGDEAALLKAVQASKKLPQWLDAEWDHLPVLQALMMRLSSSRVMVLDASLTNPVALAGEMNDLVMSSREDAARTQAKVESQAWQDAADDGWLAQQAYISNVAQAAESFTAVNVCLLETEFAPADKYAAGGMYETSIQQASNYRRQLTGDELNGECKPKPWPRPDAMTVLEHRRAIHAELSVAHFDAEVLGYIACAKLSRINGLHVDVLLLCEGDCNGIVNTIADQVGAVWRDITADAGFHYVWSPAQCPWVGSIASSSDAKFSMLMRDLELSALAERYVRPKALAGTPTFLLGNTPPVAAKEVA